MIVGREGDEKEIQEIFIDCNWLNLMILWLWELRDCEIKMASNFYLFLKEICYVIWSLSKSGRMEGRISKDFFCSLVGYCFTSPRKLSSTLLSVDSRILPQRKPKNYREEEMDMRLKNTNTHYSILDYALLVGKGKVSYILFIYILSKKAILVLLINRHSVVFNDGAKMLVGLIMVGMIFSRW